MPKLVLTAEQMRELADQYATVPLIWQAKLFLETDATTARRYHEAANNLFEAANSLSRSDEAYYVLACALIVVCKRIVDKGWL